MNRLSFDRCSSSPARTNCGWGRAARVHFVAISAWRLARATKCSLCGTNVARPASPRAIATKCWLAPCTSPPSRSSPDQPSAACSTSRATGAAALPPKPAPTSITATATLRVLGGREGDEPGVGVLRVRRRQRSGAARRCRSCRRRSRPGAPPRCRCRRGRRRSSCRAPGRRPSRGRRGGGRPVLQRRRRAAARARRRAAIVAPTLAIPSGVARSRSWPIAAAPTARSSLRSFGVGDRVRLGGRDARASR